MNEDVLGAKNTKWHWISKQIYHVMMQLVQGDAFSIVMNTTSRNGLEVWRKMIAHYEPDTRGTQRERLTELLKPNVCPELSKLTTALESFEREVAEYATKYKRRIEDDMVAAVMVGMTTGQLRIHLNLDKTPRRRRSGWRSMLTFAQLVSTLGRMMEDSVRWM